ncbi:uncharacterized protein LOC142824250 [Pelodiscus sinensis]|uniref:uncharacterized protein LOC142824250 n=1 Tax=Pelodiscus sinensis TaxID=13735 RepID=UPI003F6C55CA
MELWDDQQRLQNFCTRKEIFLELCSWLSPALTRRDTHATHIPLWRSGSPLPCGRSPRRTATDVSGTSLVWKSRPSGPTSRRRGALQLRSRKGVFNSCGKMIRGIVSDRHSAKHTSLSGQGTADRGVEEGEQSDPTAEEATRKRSASARSEAFSANEEEVGSSLPVWKTRFQILKKCSPPVPSEGFSLIGEEFGASLPVWKM